MFDFSRLRGKIREVYGTEEQFAIALGISKQSLSAKLNNKISFTAAEMNRSCELLDFPIRFIPVYFFTQKVKQTSLEDAEQ